MATGVKIVCLRFGSFPDQKLGAADLCYKFATKQASQIRNLFSYMHYSRSGNTELIQLFAVYGTLIKITETGF